MNIPSHSRPCLHDSLKAAGEIVSERYDTSYSGFFSRQQVYTTDNSSENLAGASPGKLFTRIFLKGSAFGSADHHTQILLPRKGIYGEYGQYAQTMIYVKSVSADYYDFLKAYNQYDPAAGPGGNTNP